MNTFNTFKSYINNIIMVKPPAPLIGTITYPSTAAVNINVIPNGNGGSSFTGYAYYLDSNTPVTITYSSSSAFTISLTGLTNSSYQFNVYMINAIGNGLISTQTINPDNTLPTPIITILDPIDYPLSGSVNVNISSSGTGTITGYTYTLDSVSYSNTILILPFVIRLTRLINNSYVFTIRFTYLTLNSVSTTTTIIPKYVITPFISIRYYTRSSVRIRNVLNPTSNGQIITGYAYSTNGDTSYTHVPITSIPSILDIPISSLTTGSYPLYVKFYYDEIGGYPYAKTININTSYYPSTILSSSFSITNISVSYGSPTNTQVSFTKPTTGTISNYYYTTNTSSNLDLISNYTLCNPIETTNNMTFNINGLNAGISYQIKIISAFLSSSVNYFSDESNLSSFFIPYTIPFAPILNNYRYVNNTYILNFTLGNNGGKQITHITYYYYSTTNLPIYYYNVPFANLTSLLNNVYECTISQFEWQNVSNNQFDAAIVSAKNIYEQRDAYMIYVYIRCSNDSNTNRSTNSLIIPLF